MTAMWRWAFRGIVSVTGAIWIVSVVYVELFDRIGEGVLVTNRGELSEPAKDMLDVFFEKAGRERGSSGYDYSGATADRPGFVTELNLFGDDLSGDGKKARVSAYRFQASPPPPDSRDAEPPPGGSRTGSDASVARPPIPKE